MWLAIDSHYRNDCVATAGVVFARWTDASALCHYTVLGGAPQDYEPGQFYRRELRPSLDLIAKVSEAIVGVVIDGYVTLDPSGRPGLGQHLYEALGGKLMVVGVAKNPFVAATHAVSVHRGTSKRPLLVTAIGVDVDSAARRLRMMHGSYRVPTLLKQADTLCRSALSGTAS